MKQALRMSSAAVALAVFLAVPARAQDQVDAASEPAPSLAAPSSEGAVGPAQLRDFSINGTVTRRAETPATAPAQPATAQPAPTRQPAATQVATAGAPAATRPAASASSRQAAPQQRPTASASAAGGFDFPPPTPSSDQPANFAPATFPQTTAGAVAVADPVTDTGSDSFPMWPWIVALLAALGGALWYFRRQPAGAFAGAGGDASAFDLRPAPAPAPAPRPAPQPQPAPRAAVPQPAPAPKPDAVPTGIISTRLRPWLEIEFRPEAAIVDDEKGAIQFEVTIFNSGSAPARDVFVEGALFNASPDQDQLLQQFFSKSDGQGGDRISVPPLQRMSFRSVVTLPRDQLSLYEVEGRTLFVPLVGFNAIYRWSGGQGRTSTSFIVGRNSNGEKMAPFRVDQGAKTFRGLAAREHTFRVRK